MNVLIYAIDFAPRIGGEETFLLVLGRGLSRRGVSAESSSAGDVRVTLVTRTPAVAFDDSTLPFRVVRRPSLVRLWTLLGDAEVVQLSGAVLLPMLLGLIRRKPIVILHHMYHAACPTGVFLYNPTTTPCPGYFQAGRFDKCLWCSAWNSRGPYAVLMLLATMLRRWLCLRVAANVAATNYVSRRLALPRSLTVQLGIPSSPPVPTRLPPLEPARSPICFAYVGRLVEEKGLAVFLAAARRLQDDGCTFRLRIVGDGPERARLEAMADEYRLRSCIEFTGFLQGNALEHALADVDVVVMPSLCPETAGIAAIEQMMRGRLAVVADIGGLGEVVGSGAGLKFPAGDVGKLTERLRQVLDDPSLVTRLGRAARARALQMFTQEQMVEAYRRIYEQVTDERVGIAAPRGNA